MSQAEPWWFQYLPRCVIPYVIITRVHYFQWLNPGPIFWSSLWGTLTGAIETRATKNNVIGRGLTFFFAAFLYHSAGSIWNDIIDRDIDARVERTKNRPLPSGQLSVRNALLFLLPQCIILEELARTLNRTAYLLGLVGIFVLVPAYPFMKRITYWPQAWLGLAVNWGVIVAYAADTGKVDCTAILLLLGAICWCIEYDTIYGMMDRKDDIKLGIKSTALLFGSHCRGILSIFVASFLAILITVGRFLNASGLYYIIAVGITGLHLVWQILVVDFDSMESCAMIFRSNSIVPGLMVTAGLGIVYLQKN